MANVPREREGRKSDESQSTTGTCRQQRVMKKAQRKEVGGARREGTGGQNVQGKVQTFVIGYRLP